MSDRSTVSHRYEFAAPVDIQAVLEASHIEFLDIDETRAIVLFGDAILDVDTGEGSLTHATIIDVEMFEPPAEIESTDTDAISEHLAQFADQLATRASTSVTHLD